MVETALLFPQQACRSESRGPELQLCEDARNRASRHCGPASAKNCSETLQSRDLCLFTLANMLSIGGEKTVSQLRSTP